MSHEVEVRMYRQGLGDCFLLSFKGKGGTPFHMLIDCGALNSRHYDDDLMRKVVGNILEVTKRSIDVIVLTHEHWDHISGFTQAKELFEREDTKVGAIWVAWTEDPERTDVADLKERFKKKKKAVAAALARMPQNASDRRFAAYRTAIASLMGFFDGLGAAGVGRTQQAWENALKLSEMHRYLDPRKPPVEVPQLPDVRFYVLGPPDDPEFIKKKLSSKETYEKESHGMSLADSFYAALNQENDLASASLAQPFDAHYRLSMDRAMTDAFFSKRYAFAEGSDDYWRSIEHDWLTPAGELALHLDSYTNNTCLAFAIELGSNGKVMLFPGDAQVGNWVSWDELSWQVRDSSGEKRKVTSADLLARTALYKVGHHGSHNATMKGRGLERMESDHLVAMIPVHRETANDQSWEFPFKPLLKRLKERARGRVLLADSNTLDDIKPDLDTLTKEEKESFLAAVTHEEFCVKYMLRG